MCIKWSSLASPLKMLSELFTCSNKLSEGVWITQDVILLCSGYPAIVGTSWSTNFRDPHLPGLDKTRVCIISRCVNPYIYICNEGKR